MLPEKIAPVHPGEVLLEDFLTPLKISQNMLARTMRVTPERISAIVLRRRAITADTAMRLGIALNTTPEFWMNLQTLFDLQTAQDNSETRIRREVIPLDPIKI
ncbi:MAG: HigA family addiction module antitoxin [Anaerolineaceae bacterium]